MANLSIIRDLCGGKNLSLRELARRINVTDNGIQRIIKLNSTKIETLEKIAEVLEVPVTYFFVESYQITVILENGIILSLTKRFNTFSEKISFLKDYYILKIFESIRKGILFKYPFKYSDAPRHILDAGEMNTLWSFSSELMTMPYSKWDESNQSKLQEFTYLFEAFYVVIFEKNFLSIRDYIHDGLIHDKEILKYWKIWNKYEDGYK